MPITPGMKVALVSFEYPPETGFGGIGTYAWYQARGLAKIGHDVHVLAGATSPTPLSTHTGDDGVTVHRFHADGALMKAFAALDRHRLWWSKNRLQTGLSMYRGLRALADTHDFDIIEFPECGADGWLATYLLRTPSIVRFHSPARLIMKFYDVRRADVSLCGAVEGIGIAGARAYSSCSQFLADEVREKLGVRGAVDVIPNGIDIELFDGEEQTDARDAYGIPRDRPMILFTGRMETRKGIDICTSIAADILERYEVAFVFAGRDLFGFMEQTLLPQVTARPLKGSIHYLGALDLAGVRSCVRQADIFLLPSLWENCPYSCLEAMAAGRAIVASNQGGLPELIEDGVSGLLAPVGDAAAFVSQITRLIDDGALRARLGAAARRRVETSFSDVAVARRSADFYRRVAGLH